MSELINSNDVTQDIETTERKLGNHFSTDESYKDEEHNQIEMHIGNVDTNNSCFTTSNDKMKIVLTVYGNDLRVKQPTKIGNLFSFIFINGDPLITIGPTYFMSFILFLVINIINFLLVCFVYNELNLLLKYSGIVIYFLQVFSQVYCTLINPGIPHRNNYVSESIMHSIYNNVKYNNYKFDKYRVCKKCNILVTVDQDIVHCDECNICVEGLDHHCVWIGKCIAKRNLWSFNLFITTTILFGLFTVAALINMAIANVIKHLK